MYYDDTYKICKRYLPQARRFFELALLNPKARDYDVLPTFIKMLADGALDIPTDPKDSYGVITSMSIELARRAHEGTGEDELSLNKIVASELVSRSLGSVRNLLHLKDPSLVDQHITEMSRSVRYGGHCISYELGGRRRYQVSPGLSDLLASTELRGLRAEDIRLPFHSIIIDAPEHPKFQIWNNHTGWHPFESVMLLEDKWQLNEELLDENDRFVKEPEMISKLLIPGRSIHCFFSGKSKDPNDPLDDATIFTTLNMDEEKMMEDVIWRAADIHRGRLGDYWEELLNWILNVLVYATWPEAERDHVYIDPQFKKLWDRAEKLPKKSKKRKKLLKRRSQLNPSKIFLLGKSVVLDRHRYSQSESTVKTGQKHEVRVKVSGHWRNQAHGPKRSERKLIWIQPFWRGPTDAPIKLAPRVLGKA